MDVRLPDGTVVRGVPDGFSKAQLVEKLRRNGYDVSWYKAEPNAAVASQDAALKAEADTGRMVEQAVMESPPMALARGVKDVVDTGAGLLSRAFGSDEEAARVKQMNDAGKAEYAEATRGSNVAPVGRLGGQLAATAPVGNVLAAPFSKIAPQLASALRTGGMTTGAAPATFGAKAADMGVRMLGGAATGGASAGLVDPELAGTGAAIGAAMPPTMKGVGAVAGALGKAVHGPAVPANVAAGVRSAREAGYVIPPTQAKPTLANRILEGAAGKITTAQNASARNQEVTNRLAKQAIGLSDDVQLTPEALQAVRKQAGQAYEAVRGAGTVQADDAFVQALDDITASARGAERSFPGLVKNEVADMIETLRQPAFDASDAVDAIKVLRESADSSYGKGDKAAGSAFRSASEALEKALERHLKASGQDDALQMFRQARQTIAKTYTIESAMNKASGNVEAKSLAGKLKKGKPLSGELRKAAEFAAQFPKAAQSVESMGSLPQTSPLDLWGAGLAGSVTGNPMMMGLPLLRPAARAAALSPAVQNRLGVTRSPGILSDPALLPLLYRGAPLQSSSQ